MAADQYQAAANAAADTYGVPQQIFSALVSKESAWQPYAYSSKGAIGLAQLMPGTASDLGVNAWDPVSNLNGGAAYLAQQFTKFGNWTQALEAYNAGPSGNLGGSSGYAADILKTAVANGFDPNKAPTPSPTGTAPLDEYGGLTVTPPTGATSSTSNPIADYAQSFNTPDPMTGVTAPSWMDSISNFFTEILSASFWENAIVYILGVIVMVIVAIFAIRALFSPTETARAAT